jgi:tRNA-2-methylthio-N6-dimethylallyladenosine synthase
VSDARPTVFIETYGCQMNQLDSELVGGALELAGYALCDDELAADVVLVNTCSVRQHSEHKVWSRLGRLALRKRAERPDLIIGVLGCMAEREAAPIQLRFPDVDLICGATRLHLLPLLLDNVRRNRGVQVEVGHHAARFGRAATPSDDLETLDASRSLARVPGSRQAYLRITRGCDKLCAFCVVPFTRGPEVHRAPDAIVSEARRLVQAGVREITLLGQTVNHYRHREGGVTTGFAELLWKVHQATPDLPRLRFVTSYPRDFDDETLAVMAEAPRICRYLHLPAQSGSNRMLAAMSRGYTVEEYLDLIARARARLPDVSFAGDLIAGFPGETEADHRASIALLESVRYKNCFVFQYSPRPGTVAARRFADDVPAEVKHQRNLELLEVGARIRLEHNRARIGTELEVLVEGQSRLRQHAAAGRIALDGLAGGRTRLVGRTRGDEIVAFDGEPDWIGRLLVVRAVDATPLTILATATPQPHAPSPSEPASATITDQKDF